MNKLELNAALGLAIKQIRTKSRLTQEDFSEASSRTYISTLERGLKAPTIEKIDQLAKVMGVHPVTLICQAYILMGGGAGGQDLLAKVSGELADLSGV
jgi:transcriptional regulator with XRE-family HTH domain